jgi:CRP/FNR family transcriptional regulator, cyclic AMP receptor protein
MQTIDQYLAEHPFFAGLDETFLGEIARCARNLHLRPGEFLLRSGEPAETFYAVRHGRVAIELHAPASGPVVLDSAQDGEIVGWSWLIPPYRSRFDARATTGTTAVAFDGACLRSRCEADPNLGYAVLQRVAQVMDRRLQSARVRLLDMYGVDR